MPITSVLLVKYESKITSKTLVILRTRREPRPQSKHNLVLFSKRHEYLRVRYGFKKENFGRCLGKFIF